MKYVRAYLRIRPTSDSDRVWLTAEGTPLTYNGAQEMLGQSTPTMTRRYLGWAKQEEAAKQMSEFAPI